MEQQRLDEAREKKIPWRLWGPYLSERQWGTVREDYSADGSAWEYFPHDQARSRAYRWGEDGIAGICDDKQLLCFALALWNSHDPILKERLFGLTGSEGNHAEDVKEYYFYLDNLPSHAYMKTLYKYPQGEFPYADLIETNRKRTRQEPEYELLDTGIFDEDCYFDVFTEYAKASPKDILIQITIANRGKEPATLHLLPTLWFRNTWTFEKQKKPELVLESTHSIKASHEQLETYWLFFDEPQETLFTENETNKKRLFGTDNDSPYVKDAFHRYLIQGDSSAINPNHSGTKAAPHYLLKIGAGETATVKLRLSTDQNLSDPLGKEFTAIFDERKKEADTFYETKAPKALSDDMRNVQRQAFAGLLWNKQLYHYNVEKWLKGDPNHPLPPDRHKKGRNARWWNVNAYDVFSMPDKWEYPWFASWDLAFHTVPLALIDPDFAKDQLLLLIKEWYMHPDGQILAYEWNFSDVNPPVQAWAAMRIYQIEKALYGRADKLFLEKAFHKLALNFTWWVNRKDTENRNIFEGGFLGLDNIGVFDRDDVASIGAQLDQVDGTAWMGMYCLNLLQIALELAHENHVYEDMATKFFEHFVYIADAMNNIGNQQEGLWNEEKGFYHSLLTLKGGKKIKLEVDTLVGAVPLFGVAPNNPKLQDLFPEYRQRFDWFVKHRPELLDQVMELSTLETDGRFMLSLVSPKKLKRMLEKLLSETDFLSPFGIRSVSQRHRDEPYVLKMGNETFTLDYEPAESTTSLFGGNSNWRGPIWFPLNFLLIESLQRFHYYLGESFKVEHPKGSGQQLSLWEVSTDLSHRLIKIFLKDEKGRRPVYGGIEKFQTDPHWRDYILFHEYFHGDNGAGLGASNQTGWTGLVAKLIQQYGEYVLEKKSPEVIERNRLGPM